MLNWRPTGSRIDALRRAYNATTNNDFAASTIGFIRHLKLDTPLVEIEMRESYSLPTSP
jgi:hypothetical protein